MKMLNVLYQSNDYYSVITGISMMSLLENNRDIDEINFYVLDDNISESNKNRMHELCLSYQRTLHFVNTAEILQRLIDLKVAPFKNTYTTYFKLMALKSLKIPGQRILQLDGDTIINGSLAELCDFDLDDAVCAATYDCTMNGYKALIDIPDMDRYYNCGVLLVNQKNWIDEQCEERIVDHLKNVRNGYYTVDQDIINVLFRHRIKYLDLKYNFNSGFYIYGIRESLRMYDLKEPYYDSYDHVLKAFSNPVIYHCMGAMTGRPWEQDSIHPQNELFDHYLKQSPWSDYQKPIVKRSNVFRLQRRLYLMLPRALYIPLHQLAQRWYLNKMNRQVLN